MSSRGNISRKNPTYSLINKVRIDDIPQEGLCVQFFATSEELKDLKERLCVEKFITLQAEVTIRNGETIGRNFEAWGTARAQFVQHCVATLEPLNSAIQTAISVRFSEDAQTGEGEWEIGLDDEYPPELIVSGTVDVGEAIIQHLALEIDPFPRSPGVPYLDVSSDENGIKNKSFARLSGLRNKPEN